ncbi:unnamed protein product, partial [Symbiodinium necroappetens]
EAEQVENDVNTNSVYGSKAEIAEEVFKYTSCRRIGEHETSSQANPECSYFMVFQNTAHADHSYAAKCVPAQMCMNNVVGMGVVERIAFVDRMLQQNLEGLAYIGKGPLGKCLEGMTRVNEGDLTGIIKEERAVKLGSLNVMADTKKQNQASMVFITTCSFGYSPNSGTSDAVQSQSQKRGVDRIPKQLKKPVEQCALPAHVQAQEKISADKSFNKCVNDASVGYLFVFKNGYWSGSKSDVDLGAFSKYKEEPTKIQEQKKEAAAKAKAAAVSQRRLSEQDAVLV